MLAPAPANVPAFKLNNGRQIPSVGLGCAFRGDSIKAIKIALKHGYRHFDTASLYENEEAVGTAIRSSGIPRSDVFVTTKLNMWRHHPDKVREAAQNGLEALGLDYIDLLLMHGPMAIIGESPNDTTKPDEFPTFVDTWKAMEDVVATGLVKSIGVSNFSVKNLEKLLPHCKIVPAVNQVELHPALPQPELLEYCRQKGIHVTAYSPLGQYKSPFFEAEAFKRIAEKHDKDIGQILLSWAVARGTSVIPKSANENRIKGNIEIVKLDSDDIAIIDGWHSSPRGKFTSLVTYPPSKDGTLFGWTHEQLGWNYPTQPNLA